MTPQNTSPPVRPLNVGLTRCSRLDDWQTVFQALHLRPIVLGPGSLNQLPHLDALLLGGGADIHPSHYGQARTGTLTTDPWRDALELELYDHFAGQVPILGVCRGAQMINVAQGGTLHQDMAEDLGIEHSKVHALSVAGVDRRAFPTLTVNSSHHQALDQEGRLVQVLGWAPDGIPEVWRVFGQPTLGVQFHPETLAASDARWLDFFRWWLKGFPVPVDVEEPELVT